MEGAHLRNFRRNKGLSLRAFGKQVGLSGERVRQLENYSHISPEIQERICAALGVDSADLLFTTPFVPHPKREKKLKEKKEKMSAEQAAARAAYLRDLRMELGVTQKEFAAAIGIRQNQLSAWECGLHCISDVSMERIEKAASSIRTQNKTVSAMGTRGATQPRVTTKPRIVTKPRVATEPRGATQPMEAVWLETDEPFIAVCRSGLLLSKAVVEKIGNSGRVKVYYTEASRQMAIMAAKEDEMGAPILYIDGKCKLTNTDVRKVAEKLLGFTVRNGYCRVGGTWTQDGEFEYWKFDFSVCKPNT